MFTDSLGNNTFLYQTKYHKNYRDIAGYTISRDFAFLFTNAKAEVNAVSFSQYVNINPSHLDKLNYFSFDYNREINPTRIYNCDLYNYSTFEVDNKIVTISNIFTKNLGKSFDDDDLYIKFGGKLMPMVLTVNNNYYSYNRVFNESKEYNKLVFNIGTSTYNKNTKTFCVTATEIRGGKERLVWIKFN
jgi:hypothetical protein